MHLTHLSLTNFRAYTRLDMDMPRRILLLVGENAQGKTSLLEAVYYLATFTSFLTQNDRILINSMAEAQPVKVGKIHAEYLRGTTRHRLEARLIQEPGSNGAPRMRKEILLDGIKRTSAEVLGHFNAVIFLPQMMHILEGGPDERRKFLNLAISQSTPGYGRALSEYHNALVQRNALLKMLAERGGDASQLDYWDDILARSGALLILGRIAALHELETLAARLHSQLTDSQEILRLSYQPSFDPLPKPDGQFALPIQSAVDRRGISLEAIRTGFLKQLQAARREEIERGVTACGPHRDDLRFLSNGMDLADYGSRGQVRTALLSVKLAEVGWMKEHTGHNPVLLLDEILAELDDRRRAALTAVLGEIDQAMLTTTDLKLFAPGFKSQCTLWRVKGGCVNAEEFSPELQPGEGTAGE